MRRGGWPEKVERRGNVAGWLAGRVPAAVVLVVGAVDQTDARLRGLSLGVARDRQCGRDDVWAGWHGIHATTIYGRGLGGEPSAA